MPELPDITVYVEALRTRVVGQTLERVEVVSPFLVRSVEPPIAAVEGRVVVDGRRMGKRVVLCLAATKPRSHGATKSGAERSGNDSTNAPVGADGELFLVFHLMIAGRFRWGWRGTKPPGKTGLASFEFSSGSLVLTESGSKKRASLHVVRGESELARLDPGGLEVLNADLATFLSTLRRENHTLKRALTDPRLFSGIGNAYSDEILHAARLSPLTLTGKLADEEVERLYAATRGTLQHWIDKLRQQFGDKFPGPGDITAFRPDFAVHGRFGQPCSVCGTPVQRIRYAENETNYCPGCQTSGRVLADRSLSRLLKNDWPRSIEELETP